MRSGQQNRKQKQPGSAPIALKVKPTWPFELALARVVSDIFSGLHPENVSDTGLLLSR